MFHLKSLLFGERSLTKVAGLYASRIDADAAVRDLITESHLSAEQVRLLAPIDGEAVDGGVDSGAAASAAEKPARSRATKPRPATA